MVVADRGAKSMQRVLRHEEARMNEVMERYATLEHAWLLEKERRYSPLLEALRPVSRDDLLAEPELGYLLGKALTLTGDAKRGLALLHEVAEVTRWRGNDRLHRLRLNMEGLALLHLGDTAAAHATWSELLSAAGSSGDQRRVAWATANLGVVAHLRGQEAEALLTYERALVAGHAVGDRIVVISAHINLGMAYRQLRVYPEALAHVDRALAMLGAASDNELRASAELERGFVLHYMGETRLAEFTARRVHQTSIQSGAKHLEGEDLRLIGIITRDTGRFDEARQCFDSALEIARLTDRPMLEAEIMEEIALLELAEGRVPAADAAIIEAAAIFGSIGAAVRGRKAEARLARAKAQLDDKRDHISGSERIL
jgi:tetratricopeptide (TPR) repeat protein